MKKLILSFAIATLIFSCKEETKDKVEIATEAVTSDVTESVDSAKIKTETVLDTVKSKTEEKLKNVVDKGADKVIEAADKVKKSVKK
ncbi:MAG: hypothetical protein ABI549_02780 [Flavobacterium sp.]|uniref:hypothetical protein n=1 Tax=Flavobacterium sp. TaxID=239 RepID=UPI0032649FF9